MSGGDVRPDVAFLVTDVITTRFITPLAAELRRRGHTVGIVTNFHGEALPRELDAVTDVWVDVPMRRSPSPVHDVVDLFRLTRVLRRLRPRLVHASTPKAGLLGSVAARLARVPHVVFQVRGLRSEGTTGLGRRIQLATEAASMRAAHTVVFNSQSMLTAAAEAGLPTSGGIVIGDGSSIGVDTTALAPLAEQRAANPRAATDPFTLGFIGRLHTDKGAAVLIPVLERLAATPGLPEIRLVVAGDVDPTDPASPAIADALAARPDVDLLGWVDDVAEILGRIDLLVFPSIREGLPNAPLEAQAAGVPVVGFAATGTVDAVRNGEGGVLVPVGDTDGLALAVAAIAGDPTTLARLANDGRRSTVEHFDQGRVVAQQVDVLVGLLGPD